MLEVESPTQKKMTKALRMYIAVSSRTLMENAKHISTAVAGICYNFPSFGNIRYLRGGTYEMRHARALLSENPIISFTRS